MRGPVHRGVRRASCVRLHVRLQTITGRRSWRTYPRIRVGAAIVATLMSDELHGRTSYNGAVRHSEKERERDARMLALLKDGVPVRIIADRMGVTSSNVRIRLKRAAATPLIASSRTTG